MHIKFEPYSRFLCTTALCAAVTVVPAVAVAAPQGGVVAGGALAISQNGSTTTIKQSSSRAIIKWDSFDVDASDHIKFEQPSKSSITVNRILDSKASRIDGRITANGNVVLINPNGVVFGTSSSVDVGGLVATTSDIEDDNAFLAGGDVKFTKPGKPDASIVNNGSITVRNAGLAGLVAPHVENNGVIQAKMGRVHLASGDMHTVDFAGDGLISVQVSDNVKSQLVHNNGSIDADGGEVLITAAQARDVVDSLITNKGEIRARTTGSHKGSVKITTRDEERPDQKGTGKIVIEGKIDVAGIGGHENGGDITILSDRIEIQDGARLDASGDYEGGTIRIGGAFQGGEGVPTADFIDIGQDAILNAAGRAGKGGVIVLWSDQLTRYLGHAGAGSVEGAGGLIEVSGKERLDFSGTVDLRGRNGQNGTLLLDPTNITISAGGNSNVTGASPYSPTIDDATSVLNVTTLLNALANGNVIVQTRATGVQAGNITVDSALSWANGNLLTLDAHGSVIINQAISGSSLTMIAGTDVQLNANVGGSGALTMYASGNGTSVGIGGGAGTFNVSAAELARILNGWQDIIIGKTTTTATMTANAATWNDNITLRSGSGAISIAGVQTVAAGNNMSIITDGDIVLGVTNAITGNSTGTLNISQSSAGTSIGLGGAGTINLSATEIGRMTNNWSAVNIGRTDGSGAITMSTATWNDPLTIQSGSGLVTVSGVQTMGGNNLTFLTDGDLSFGAVANILFGTGTLAFRQVSANGTIGLGDAQAGTMNLSAAEIARIRDGWGSIVFGRTDGTGAINIGTTTWLDHLTLQTGAGAINVNNNVTLAGNNLKLSTAGGDVTTSGTISQSSGGTTINTAGGKVTLNGGITQTSTGSIAINSDGGDIATAAALTQATGNMNINSAGGAMTFGAGLAGTTTGTMSLLTGGGALTLNGNLSKTGGTVTIDSGSGLLTLGGALSFGAANAGISTTHTAGISLASAVAQSTGHLTLTTAGGDITAGAAAPMTQTSTGNIIFTSNGGDITIDGAITQSAGAGGTISLNTGNGALAINGAITRLGGALNIDTGSGTFTSAAAIALGTGAASIITNGINLGGNLSGTGALGISQYSNNVSIGLGAGQAGTLNLDGTEMGYIQDGWSSRTFGRTDSTEAFNVAGGQTWTDHTVLQTGTGLLNINGTLAVGGNNLTLRTDSNPTLSGAVSGTGAFALIQSSAGTSMGIGDGQAGTIHLSTAETAFIGNTWSSQTYGRADGTGALNIAGGLAWGDPTSIRTGAGQLNINGDMLLGANNLTISTDSDLYLGGNVTGTEYLAIVGSSAATSVGLGTGQAGMLYLDDAELVRLGNVWRGVTIGTTTMTGDMNVGSRTWGDALTLRTGTGQMNINGLLNTGNNRLTIYTDSDLNINAGGALSGTNTLNIAQSINSTSFGLGNGMGGTIMLTDAELDRITNGWGSIIIGSTSGTGSMNVGARTWNDNLTLNTAAGAMIFNGAQSMGVNNLTLVTTSNLSINGALSGTGTLSISGGTSIGVGDGQAGTLSLTDAELDLIQAGWSSVILTSTGTTTTMSIAGRSWNNSMDFRTNSGALNINGAQNMGANNLTLRTNTNLAINYALAGTGTLSILPNAGAVTNSMGIGNGTGGQLNLSDAELALFENQGWDTLAFGNSGSLGALTVAAHNWDSNVIFRNAGNASNFLNIQGTQNMGSKNLTLTTNNDIVVDGDLIGTGTLTIAQSIGTASLAIGSSQTGTNTVVTLSDAEIARIGSGWADLVFGTTTNAASNTTYGQLNIGANTWNSNVTFRSQANVINVNGTQNAGAHDLTFQTNANPAVNAALNGTGKLTFTTTTASTTIGVNGATGTMNLSSADLGYITDGWDDIVIGRTDGTGAMGVSARTWTDNLTLQTGSGALTVAGATMGANDLTLRTNSSLGITGNLVGSGNLTIRNSSGLTNIAVGTGQTGTLVLDDTEIGRIQDGWSKVTIGSDESFGNINAAGRVWINPMTFVTQGDVVLNGVQGTTETAGTALVFATTGGKFINNAGASAINPGSGRYLVYSVDDANDTLGGIIRPTIISNESYASYAPGSVSEAGDVFLYSGAATKILFLAIDDAEKIYGNAVSGLTYSYIGGLQNDDLLSDVILSHSLFAVGATLLDEAGTMRALTGTFNAGLGYAINVIDGTLTVVKALLTVEANSENRIYGDANPALTFSYSGFKNGDDESSLDADATVSTLATSLSNAGNYAITVSGGLDDNYDFSYVDGNLRIDKAMLTATAQNATREYGDSNPGLGIVYTGFKNGETQSVIDTAVTAATVAGATSNVGSYAINASGGLDNNYDFSYVGGNLSITKAALTATAQNASRAYGDVNPTLSVVYTGFKNGETQSVIDTKASAVTTANAASGVGTYGITASGAADNNYSFTYADGTLTVNKSTLSAAAQNAARDYGDANPAFSVVYTGFKNGETESVINTLASAGSSATALTGAGVHTILATGAADDNYDFSYVPGALTINKVTLTATAQNASRQYGDANPAFSVVYTGFRNGETQGVIDTLASVSSGAGMASQVGTYDITASGAADDNYNFNYVDGILTVGKAMLTATAQNASRSYGDANPALSVVYTGFKNGETNAVIDTLAAASTSATGTSGVGDYGIAVSGAADENYDFSYVDGILTIGKATLTATANDQSRSYGSANPGLTVSYNGFKNGESAAVITAQASAATGATAASDAGTYAITVSGGTDDNYDFTYIDGDLIVNKALLTVTAGSGTRVYGDSNPAFTVSYAGFVNSDDIDDLDTLPTVSSAAAGANAGTHAVTASGGFDNNYTFSYAAGVLNITKATLAATAADQTRFMNQPNPVFITNYTGFKNGDTQAMIDMLATASAPANAGSPAGTYTITASGAFDNNYDFTYAPGLLTVVGVAPPSPPLHSALTNNGAYLPPPVEISFLRSGVYEGFQNYIESQAFSYMEEGIITIPDESLQAFGQENAQDYLIAITDELKGLTHPQ